MRWVEVFQGSLQLNATPLSIADVVRKQVTDSARAWVFTSATLSVRGDFSHYQSEMGLHAARTAAWDSPFGSAWRIALCARYWHFMLAVWLVLFALLSWVTPEVARFICGTS